jgi:hypothetical protein
MEEGPPGIGGVCDNLYLTVRNLLILNVERCQSG